MKRIKRLSLLLLILVFGFILGGCTCKPDNENGGNGTTPAGSVTLDFYSLNDFMGQCLMMVKVRLGLQLFLII